MYLSRFTLWLFKEKRRTYALGYDRRPNTAEAHKSLAFGFIVAVAAKGFVLFLFAQQYTPAVGHSPV
ncbi:hypothetical protein IMSAGC014_00240 [Bacteroidaceae bacterium]|nr:hypothetical protein IMSAGC014_00240 [Bacteroidaceae bacterium]